MIMRTIDSDFDGWLMMIVRMISDNRSDDEDYSDNG